MVAPPLRDWDDFGMVWSRSKQETLGLPINTLALLILKDYTSGGGWNWQNWMRRSEQRGTAQDPEIGAALVDGWGWLMTHGLVVRDPIPEFGRCLPSNPARWGDTEVRRRKVDHRRGAHPDLVAAKEANPLFAEFERRTTRQIPVIILEMMR